MKVSSGSTGRFERYRRRQTMTVTDLVKKLRQYEEIGTIASVRIEFGDGSIYDVPPIPRRVMQASKVCIMLSKASTTPAEKVCLRAVMTHREGKRIWTGEYACSVCGQRFRPDP